MLSVRYFFRSGEVDFCHRQLLGKSCLGEPLRITHHEDFESVTIGGYTQNDLNGNVDWIQHRVGQSPTDGPTTKYLPTHDSTFGMTGEGKISSEIRIVESFLHSDDIS